jgi:hypothetical protein
MGHTHVVPGRVFHQPFLYPRSPEKRCGKTTLMLVMYELVRRPLLVTNVAPAPLFRCIEEFRPTLLLDEADTWLRENEELRGILNGGHSRKTARVIRCVGDEHEVPAVLSRNLAEHFDDAVARYLPTASQSAAALQPLQFGSHADI